MIPLTNHDFQGSVEQWGRSEVVMIYPDEMAPLPSRWEVPQHWVRWPGHLGHMVGLKWGPWYTPKIVLWNGKIMENDGKWWKMMENDHKPLENRWILRINLETPLTIGKPLLNGCWGALFNPYFLKGDRCRLAQDPDSSGLKGTANLGSLLWNFGQIIGRKKRTS